MYQCSTSVISFPPTCAPPVVGLLPQSLFGLIFSLSKRIVSELPPFFYFFLSSDFLNFTRVFSIVSFLPKLRPVFNINFMILKGLRAAQKARLGSLWAGKGVSLPLPSSTRQPLSLQFRSNGMTAFYSTSSPPPSDEGKPP